MADKIKVAIAGINGRMGRASVPLIAADADMKLVAAVGRPGSDYVGKNVNEVTCAGPTDIRIVGSIAESLDMKPDVLLDFTVAEPAIENAKYALEHGVRPIIGVSGISPESLEALTALAAQKKLGAMVVPNFSIGAVLMMEFARQAGKHFSNVEIVEMHHTKKLDAPSGTSMHTMRKIEQSNQNKTFNTREVEDKEILIGARGAVDDAGIRVHSLRLPGLISHQDVIFGSDGELLSIRHDSFNTNCFVRGILMSIKAVMKMDHLVVGLESLL